MKLAVLTSCVSFTSQVKSKNNIKHRKLFNLNMVHRLVFVSMKQQC